MTKKENKIDYTINLSLSPKAIKILETIAASQGQSVEKYATQTIGGFLCTDIEEGDLRSILNADSDEVTELFT